MKKKLNIAFLLDNFYPQVNGVVTSSINTAVEIKKRGHNVSCVTSYSKDLKNKPAINFPFPIQYHKGFPAYFYPDFNFTNLFSRKLIKTMKEFKPDLKVLQSELESYTYDLSPSGSLRDNAPEGLHDDCVIALALAAMQIKTIPPPLGGSGVCSPW